MEDVTYVLHLASPMASSTGKDEENEVIKPAIEGNVNVLNACIGSTVQRVVITSSGLTICDHKKGEGVYSHDSFVEEDKSLDAYSKSKIRAEQAAITLVEDLEEKGKRTFDVMFIHPGGISGRPLVPQFKGESIKMFAQILDGQFSRVPKVYYPMVDVQDTAQAHINAIEYGTHLGRYPLANGTYKFKDLCTIMKDKYGPMGYKASDKELCKTAVFVGSLFSKDVKNIYFHWEIKAELDGEYAKNELHLDDYISAEDSIIDTCDFLIENSFVKEPKKKKGFFG
uniref:3-beta hydroxysteroid dehydrogenase/isomerase domain-containing protein n=1 Tax=Euplotes crassus TaxID=5936 RepID=A0A7S3NLI8_EUPCR|mmetsp:Transcript_11102/g.11037  ORF Transcript_11102/g.11037 Transcript_11102/m.11037 type:complete len:283 (+) Transcript_11102:236-1084(+)